MISFLSTILSVHICWVDFHLQYSLALDWVDSLGMMNYQRKQDVRFCQKVFAISWFSLNLEFVKSGVRYYRDNRFVEWFNISSGYIFEFPCEDNFLDLMISWLFLLRHEHVIFMALLDNIFVLDTLNMFFRDRRNYFR